MITEVSLDDDNDDDDVNTYSVFFFSFSSGPWPNHKEKKKTFNREKKTVRFHAKCKICKTAFD